MERLERQQESRGEGRGTAPKESFCCRQVLEASEHQKQAGLAVAVRVGRLGVERNRWAPFQDRQGAPEVVRCEVEP